MIGSVDWQLLGGCTFLNGENLLLLAEKFKSLTVLYSLNLKDVVCATFSGDARHYSGLFMDVPEMAAQVTGLSESLIAERTDKWSHLGVLAEVISKIAALGELLATILIFATEVQFDTVSG